MGSTLIRRGKENQDARDAAQKDLEAVEKEIDEAKKAENPKPIVERLTKEKLEPSKHKLADAQAALDQSGSYKMVRELKGHSKAVRYLMALPTNENQMISGSEDGQAIIWDTSNGSAVRKFNLGRPITNIAVRPDGKQFAATDAQPTVSGLIMANKSLNPKAIAMPMKPPYMQALAKFAVSELQYRRANKKLTEENKAEERLR